MSVVPAPGLPDRRRANAASADPAPEPTAAGPVPTLGSRRSRARLRRLGWSDEWDARYRMATATGRCPTTPDSRVADGDLTQSVDGSGDPRAGRSPGGTPEGPWPLPRWPPSGGHLAPERRSFVPARVTDVDGSSCGCLAPTGPTRATVGPGQAPVAGDWAVMSGTELITVLPRTSVVRRGCGPDDVRGEVLAANVDLVLVVQAFSPDLTLARTERLLALATAGAATPVLVLSQLDRAPDGAAARSALADLAVLAESCPGTAVVGISARPGDRGMHRLRTLLLGSVAAVFGPPGAGKSTVVDVLCGAAPRAGATLVPLPGGGALIDTPGCDPDAPDWLAERYVSRLRAAQRARWRAGSSSGRRLRPLAGGA